MLQSEPKIQTMKASEARENFSRVLNEVFRRQTRVLVERSGIPVAAIISAEDLQELTRLEEQRRERFELLDRMREAFADLSEEQIEAGVAEVVARMRQQGASKSSPAA